MPTTRDITLQKFNAIIIFTCIMGFALSYYAYNVEVKKEEDKSFEAMCDISEYISCTKVFTTEYGKGFGLIPKDSIFNVPNSLYGIGFYPLIAVLSKIDNYTYSFIVVILGILSNIGTIYLVYTLYMINSICVVCCGIYVINAIIGYFAIKKFKKLLVFDALKKK